MLASLGGAGKVALISPREVTLCVQVTQQKWSLNSKEDTLHHNPSRCPSPRPRPSIYPCSCLCPSPCPSSCPSLGSQVVSVKAMGTIAFFQVHHIWEGCPRVLPLHLQPAPFCNINLVLINVSSAFYLISPHYRLLTFELGIMKNRCVYSTHPYTFPRFGT